MQADVMTSSAHRKKFENVRQVSESSLQSGHLSPVVNNHGKSAEVSKYVQERKEEIQGRRRKDRGSKS